MQPNKIYYLAPISDGGYGAVAANTAECLIKKNEPVWVIPTSVPPQASDIPGQTRSRFVSLPALKWIIEDPEVPLVHHSYPGGFIGHGKILMTVHETEKWPDPWVEKMQGARGIIVPTHWQKETLLANHDIDSPVYVVPHGINPMDSYEYHRPSKDKFRFLVLDKAADVCVKGFIEAFGDDPDVELLVKVRKHTCYFDEDQFFTDNIKILSKDFVPQDMITQWHYQSHCLLHPVEGAGWGLPISDSLVRGVPVIAIRQHGITEYTEPGELCEPEYETKPFQYEPWVPDGLAGTEWGHKHYATVEGVAQACIDMKNNYNAWKEKTIQAGQRIRGKYTWEQSADQWLEAVKEIIAK